MLLWAPDPRVPTTVNLPIRKSLMADPWRWNSELAGWASRAAPPALSAYNNAPRAAWKRPGEGLPSWIPVVLGLLPRRGLLGRLLAWTARRGAERLARKFIAGSNVHEALVSVNRLRARSLTFTVDLLGEATLTEAEAEKAQA